MSHEIDRRSLLRLGALGLSAPLVATATPALASTSTTSTPRTARTTRLSTDLAADRIVASVRRPWFPPRNFPVTGFGAVGDGTTKNTAAFAAAIATCSRAG